MTIFLHKNDLPDDVTFGDSIAVDCETMGLKPSRDRLCVVQLSAGNGDAHLVQFQPHSYDAPNLKAVLADQNVIKMFHYARFDVAIIKDKLGVDCTPVYCTKIASRLVRTFTDRHGLRECCRELLGVELNKQQQSSYWGADKLTEEQKAYAANDVLYLHRLREVLDRMLEKEGRTELFRQCCDFLPVRAALDLEGWDDTDIFIH